MVLESHDFMLSERAINDWPRELSEALVLTCDADEAISSQLDFDASIDLAAGCEFAAAYDVTIERAVSLVAGAIISGDPMSLAHSSLHLAGTARQASAAGIKASESLLIAASVSQQALAEMQFGKSVSFEASASVALAGIALSRKILSLAGQASLEPRSAVGLDASVELDAAAGIDEVAGKVLSEVLRLTASAELQSQSTATLRPAVAIIAAANLISTGLMTYAAELELKAETSQDITSAALASVSTELAATSQQAAACNSTAALSVTLDALAELGLISAMRSVLNDGICVAAESLLEVAIQSRITPVASVNVVTLAELHSSRLSELIDLQLEAQGQGFEIISAPAAAGVNLTPRAINVVTPFSVGECYTFAFAAVSSVSKSQASALVNSARAVSALINCEEV